MAKDASFERIEAIRPHPNADRLEIATISGWSVVVGKGEFSVGDVVFYIREDAKLLDWDRLKAADGHPDVKCKWPWQEKLIQYLGSGGRVKTVKLRGEYSCGIAVSLEALYGHINTESAKDWEKDNEILNSESPGGLLSGKYGVTHWEAPVQNIGDLKAKGGLPYSIPKSDEENFQNLKEYEIPYGEEVLITKKMDGASTTVIAFPDGRTHVCSRSNDLVLDCDNVWNRAAKDIIPLALEWAKHYNRPLVLRGETCAPTLQKMSFNKDKDVPEPTFYTYGVMMIDETDYAKRNGLWGTDYHFLKIAEQIKEITGKELRTVPVLGTAVLTKELLNEYLNKPLEFGEGIVLNTKKNHFKCKSLAYLEAISKKN